MILPGSLLAVIVIIGGMEYHLRHFNTAGSWRLFAYVLGVETDILLPAVMLWPGPFGVLPEARN